MTFTVGESEKKECDFETAIDLTGFGKYNINMLICCCLLIIAMYMDIFCFSVIMPAVACDLSLNTSEQGVLSAAPLIGVMISSYGWGLAADTIGRRKTLLIAMPVGFILNIATSMAPGYTLLGILKFLSATFTSSANAAAFVLMAESVPGKHRSRFMFIMASITMLIQFLMCSVAVLVFKLTFHLEISWLGVVYRPWRLLMQIISLPCAIGIVFLLFLKESPKFLLSVKRDEEALKILQTIFNSNTGGIKDDYPVLRVYLDDRLVPTAEKSVLKKMWNQTAPLFKPPLLKNSVILYYLLLCAYMTSTGFTMWVTTMTNAFFTGEDSSGLTFCEVASRSAYSNVSKPKDCDQVINPTTLYTVMCYSGFAAILSFLLSFLVGPLGKKTSTLLVFVICSACGICLFFTRNPLLNIVLFYLFIYVCLILGNVNTYLVELNPTHLRGMATCLSVVVARGFGFFSVQVIANLLENYCTSMISGYLALVLSGLAVACFLPTDSKSKKSPEEVIVHESTQKSDIEKD